MSLAQQLVRARADRLVLARRRTGGSWCAGGRASSIASRCPTSWRRTSTTCSTICAAPATRSRRDWFRAHREFRFPLLGTHRRAPASSWSCARRSSPGTCSARSRARGGTARYVDSSLERLEVKVRGMVDSRHVVACAGRRVPLHPTGTPGRVRGRRALPRLAPAVGAAPDHRRPRAAGVRRHRHLERPRDRRLHLPRLESGRPRLRAPARQRAGGRGAAHRPLLPVRPHARARWRRRPRSATATSR